MVCARRVPCGCAATQVCTCALFVCALCARHQQPMPNQQLQVEMASLMFPPPAQPSPQLQQHAYVGFPQHFFPPYQPPRTTDVAATPWLPHDPHVLQQMMQMWMWQQQQQQPPYTPAPVNEDGAVSSRTAGSFLVLPHEAGFAPGSTLRNGAAAAARLDDAGMSGWEGASSRQRRSSGSLGMEAAPADSESDGEHASGAGGGGMAGRRRALAPALASALEQSLWENASPSKRLKTGTQQTHVLSPADPFAASRESLLPDY